MMDQIKFKFNKVNDLIKQVTVNIMSDKTVIKLHKSLQEMESYIKQKGVNYEELTKRYSTVNTFFCNLNRDKKFNDNTKVNKILADLNDIGKMIRAAKSGKPLSGQVVSKMSALSLSPAIAAATTPGDNSWNDSPECRIAVRKFHDEYATKGSLNEAKRDLEGNMRLFRQFLETMSLCKRLEYTGSVYEEVNISGDELEFDVMFVADGKIFQCVPNKRLQKGYTYLKTRNQMHNLTTQVDGNGYVNAKKYNEYFGGIVQLWLNKMDTSKIKQRGHGVATQIDVHKDGKLWYKVDLVPCFEIERELYVPKHLSTDVMSWRHSFSLREKKILTSMDGNNECRRHCVRVIKAIFKLRISGLFRNFTSYHIKTIMFYMNEKNGINWYEQNLGKCVLLFLNEVKLCLEKGELHHKFEPTINLLDSIKEQRQQMIGFLNKILTNQNRFYETIKCC
ncbi:uncharacterized protein LOC130657949 [Hydractinia symbiolongicarpus]|uniref:uncharacterized protein LOC130657949 n=1 Tax=Hydractinia symbiolongicarpus TaxID=13093 RepID=UPI00254E3D68|nr:uncharacterized protein LOC130657949 [Hydractinia symbiolongicarpus]XP_057316933.1 uncharacterized protein LOC130657949 [Hydractinia symbiolongicarpus]XP_057316934.1 uncharacterized protein LOC130657949 [Hydractinia symbiolongicarpus]XP_057316935.1 uncharacterized protein LOC130657949 [Hydractinia symbiolongicarpus]